MQISLTDFVLLLNDAEKNECLILLDDVYVIRFSFKNDRLIITTVANSDYETFIFYTSTTITIEESCIKLKLSTYEYYNIEIYKKPITKEEYLTTLEFLKNE